MKHLDLHEQEQVAQVKYFWRDWGKYIAIFVLILVVAYVVSEILNMRASSKSLEASNLYSQLQQSITLKDTNKVFDLTNKLEQEYPDVFYSDLSGISAAKIATNVGNNDLAIKYLSWVIDNSKVDGIIAVAKLNIANIYIDQKKFDKALEILQSNKDDAFYTTFFSARGDLYVAKGDFNKAKDAYKEALKKAGNDNNATQSLQMKIDLLGG